jgi:hypothetical protein
VKSEAKESMGKNGEGERGPTEARDINPPQESSLRKRALSFSTVGKTDTELLSFFSERASTVKSVSAKVGISFMECLHRAKRLERIGLLKRIGNSPGTSGLYLYLAVY